MPGFIRFCKAGFTNFGKRAKRLIRFDCNHIFNGKLLKTSTLKLLQILILCFFMFSISMPEVIFVLYF